MLGSPADRCPARSAREKVREREREADQKKSEHADSVEKGWKR